MENLNKYLIFIYDDCMKGLKNHYLIQNSKYYKDDIIPKYNLMILDNTVIAIKNKNIWNPLAKIYVEAYYIDDKILEKLDKHYKVKENYFQRTNVKSRSGKWGVLYYANEKKSRFSGKGELISQKYDIYLQNKEKYDILKKKRRNERNEYDEEQKKLEEKRIKEKS